MFKYITKASAFNQKQTWNKSRQDMKIERKDVILLWEGTIYACAVIMVSMVNVCWLCSLKPVFFLFPSPEANRDLDSDYIPICFAVVYSRAGATNWQKANLPPLLRHQPAVQRFVLLVSPRERPHSVGRILASNTTVPLLHRKAEQLYFKDRKESDRMEIRGILHQLN